MLIKSIRFKDKFNAAALQEDLQRVQHVAWTEHYNRGNYEGHWGTLQLRSVNGLAENNSAIHPGSFREPHVFKDTPLMGACPYIQQVVDFFKIEKTAVRLMKLGAGAVIKTHCDDGLNFEEGEVRIHVPVITNPRLLFLVEGERIIMEEGSCWYLNLSLPHSVRNEGTTDRIHLVIDGIVNPWLQDYFNDAGHLATTMEAPKKNDYANEEKLKIIMQLREMNTDTSHQLADEMEATLLPKA